MSKHANGFRHPESAHV